MAIAIHVRLGDAVEIQVTSLYDRMVRYWLISAVARVYAPGCQVDHTLILQSKQGKYKSTWFDTLAGQWFSDSVKDIEAKDSLMTIHSSWIIELAEINRVTSKKQAAIVKHFLTQKEDTFRKPYDKEVERNPRRSVFCGTVNPAKFLVDEENRRFWVIPVNPEITAIDIPRLERERDGIWSAAVEAYKNGAAWYPTDEEKRAIAEATKDFEEEDVWTGSIASYLKNRNNTTIYDIMLNDLDFEPSKMSKRDEMRVSNILKRLGWFQAKRKRNKDGSTTRVWQRPDIAQPLIQNTITHPDGEVGRLVKGQSQQGLEVCQPVDRPLSGLVCTDPESIPTSDDGVGDAGTRSQQGMCQPTGLDQPIPETHKIKGFKYPLEVVVQDSRNDSVYRIKEFPGVGTYFSQQRYGCEPIFGGDIEWIQQKYLHLC